MTELTVSWDSKESLSQGKWRKNEKVNYQVALSDLTNLGIRATPVTIEIGCLGHHMAEFFSAPKKAAPSITPAERTELRDELTKIGNHFFPCHLSTWTFLPCHLSTWTFLHVIFLHGPVNIPNYFRSSFTSSLLHHLYMFLINRVVIYLFIT